MFSYVEETEEGTVLYQVRTYRWCMCWAFFNASEVFELTGIPYLYRKALGVHKKPSFLEWLGKLFKNPCYQAGWNKNVPFSFS